MTCTVISYEITLEKCICVSRTMVSTVSPCMISGEYECLGEVIVVTDPFLQKCIGFDDCNIYLIAFRLSTCINCNFLIIFIYFYLKPSKVELV